MPLRRLTLALVAIALSAGCAQAPSSPFITSPQAKAFSLAAGLQAHAASATTGAVLYVANLNGANNSGDILVYNADIANPKLLNTIATGANRPNGLWVDSSGILYVVNEDNGGANASVSEFKPGQSQPFQTITQFTGNPATVAVDAKGNIFVSENAQNSGVIDVYAPSGGAPVRTIQTGVSGYAFTPGGMGFDPSGNLIVAAQAKLALHIVSISPGASKATPLNVNLANIDGPGLAIDSKGNMYVSSGGAGTVSVFPPGAVNPLRTIAGVSGYGLTAVSAKGTIYQASTADTVAVITPNSGALPNNITCQCQTTGVAVRN